MLDKDWTGTAAAVAALVMTAGVWLWPEAETPGTTPAAQAPAPQITALDQPRGDDMARLQAEARRWDGLAGGGNVQLSSVDAADSLPPLVR